MLWNITSMLRDISTPILGVSLVWYSSLKLKRRMAVRPAISLHTFQRSNARKTHLLPLLAPPLFPLNPVPPHQTPTLSTHAMTTKNLAWYQDVKRMASGRRWLGNVHQQEVRLTRAQRDANLFLHECIVFDFLASLVNCTNLYTICWLIYFYSSKKTRTFTKVIRKMAWSFFYIRLSIHPLLINDEVILIQNESSKLLIFQWT